MDTTASEPDRRRTGLAAVFAEISRALYSAHTVEETLRLTVGYSVGTIDACSGAVISVLEGEEIVTRVWSQPEFLEVETAQYRTHQGPSVDAITRGVSFFVDDFLTDTRWPDFGPEAARAGIRSALAFCLVGERVLGVLTLYAQLPRAFGATDRATGLIFATHAGVALAAAEDLADVTEALAVETMRLENLHGALATRQLIGRAEGILMQRELITADQAFDLLRQASQNLNTKLNEIAQYVVDTGDIPSSNDHNV